MDFEQTADRISLRVKPLCAGNSEVLCNGQKATLSYAEWIDRVVPQHRSRVIALYQERHGRATQRAA